ncbi:MAG TPA: DegT/DnrJ/EryC1/StrS family aminotransferase [Elusimicrobiota bacterium]|nr:DegT/DnrJ/EryC1/StrS family aminotransferase [Elusimicrobiota bacterium]
MTAAAKNKGVPYSYLSRQFADVDPILAKIKELVRFGDFTLGKPVTEFEEKFAALIGAKYAVGVGSGTDALFLSLKALGVGAGDEVITMANTFVATAGAIETAGAKIVFVDCDEKGVIDVSKIEAAITPRTKVLMPVVWGGQPPDMPRVMELAKKHKLQVIEDACQGIGGAIGGRNCGAWGIMAGFSLHPLKNINVWGDGGVIVTSSEELRDKLRLLRNHGMSSRDEYAFFAYNSRLDSLQAVVGLHEIGNFRWITDARIANAKVLDAALGKLKGKIALPPRDPKETHVYHLYQFHAQDRDGLLKFLQARGIEAKVHYPIPLHLQPASRHLGCRKGDFPMAEADAAATLTLPVHQHLTKDELRLMISSIEEFYAA